jgi:hypothetical protein
MLRATSVVLDVIQGPRSPLAYAFREWCITDWPRIEAVLTQLQEEEASTVTAVLQGINRAIQVKLHVHINALLQSRLPEPFSFSAVTGIVLERSFHLLPALPPAYRASTPRNPAVPRPPAASGSGTSGRGSGGAALGGVTPATDPRGGTLVLNEQVDAALKARFVATNLRLTDLKELAPDSKDRESNGRPIPICLGWHLMGRCYTNCRRAPTHRALTAPERTTLNAFYQEHCTAASPVTPAAPTAAT